MGNSQYVIGNADRGDATAFTVPGDEDGGAGDNSFRLETEGLGKSQDGYVHIENGWDTNVDVTLRGSHFLDESMSSASDDGSAITVNSGGDTDFFDITSSHTFIEVNVDPAADPTSGDLTITFQSREA